MDEVVILVIVIIGTIVSVFLAFRRLGKQEPVETVPMPITHSSPNFTFEEVSKHSEVVFRCPNLKCRAVPRSEQASRLQPRQHPLPVGGHHT